MQKVLVVLGTRPEAIKLAPVIEELRRAKDRFVTRVLATSQHREMLGQVLDLFSIRPDLDLQVMREDQGLPDLTARLLSSLRPALEAEAPDAVLVQGDTTTVLAASLASYYLSIPVGHVEAGLRTGDLRNPFPEELNRRVASLVARWHFCPTARARDNLLREGTAAERIHLVGNTVVDALASLRPALEGPLPPALRSIDFEGSRVIAVTMHRRETFGERQRAALSAMAEVLRLHPDAAIVFPVHPNPRVRRSVEEVLAGRERVHLVPPLSYRDFLVLLARCHLVLTDSGGVQEEAPSLGKPVLVLREATERPEGIEAGVAELVGTDPGRIVAACSRLLGDAEAHRRMVAAANPYGDGRAAGRIVEALAGGRPEPPPGPCAPPRI